MDVPTSAVVGLHIPISTNARRAEHRLINDIDSCMQGV